MRKRTEDAPCVVRTQFIVDADCVKQPNIHPDILIWDMRMASVLEQVALDVDGLFDSLETHEDCLWWMKSVIPNLCVPDHPVPVRANPQGHSPMMVGYVPPREV